MSSRPSKSQSNGPLHNFSLGDLKWSSSHHRGRRVDESSSEQSPASDAAQRPITLRVLIGGVPVSQYVPSKTARSSAPDNADKAISSSSSDHVAENASASEDLGEKPLLKKPIRLPKKKPVEVPQEEEVSNMQNLRPRKPQEKPLASHPASKVDGKTLPDDKAAIPPAAEDIGGSKDLPKKLKLPKFSLTLTPQEIEEDIFALTGRRPSRKPMRRPEAAQQQLDTLFPGMRIASVTPKDYKVPEASKKKKK